MSTDATATGDFQHTQGNELLGIARPAAAKIKRRLTYIHAALERSPDVPQPVRDWLLVLATTEGGPWDGDIGQFLRMNVQQKTSPGPGRGRDIVVFSTIHFDMELPIEV